jgi:hypothetical protein
MRISAVTSTLLVLSVVCLTTNNAAAQSAKALYTGYPPYLCVGGGFVAMMGISKGAALVVISIDDKGIEAPQPTPVPDVDIRGMGCSGSHIELLVRGEGVSGHYSTILFIVRGGKAREWQRQDLNWSGYGPTQPEIEYEVDSLDWVGSRAGGFMRGDWYVWVPRVVGRPNNSYELHFISSHGRGYSKFVADLLEESADKKVTRSVPLVRIEADDDAGED